MLTATFALFCLAGWIATSVVFVIAMSGSSNMREKERAKTDTIAAAYRAECADHERTREQLYALTQGDDVVIVPLAESPAFERIADVIAFNEAGRMDADLEDWTPVMPEDRR